METTTSKESKGIIIKQAISVLRQSFSEASLLLKDFDELMKENGWSPLYGNNTTRDLNTRLSDPDKWLLQGSFRIYENDKYKNKNKETRLGITIQWWNAELSEQKEPLLLIAKINCIPNDCDHWVVWYAWEDEPKRLFDSTAYTGNLDNWNYIASARPLTSITNKNMLEELVKELIGYLEKDPK
jgi:hypothetical protein